MGTVHPFPSRCFALTAAENIEQFASGSPKTIVAGAVDIE
jgi:hypothetical protein